MDPGLTLVEIALRVTDLAGTSVVFTLTPLAAVVLAIAHQQRAALAVVAAVAVSQASVALIKSAVERQRPPASEAVVHASGYSFPSGHATTSVALYGALAVFAVMRLSGRLRAIAIAVGVGIPVAVGLTRVYLGAHYATDVLAGWLLGALITLAAYPLLSTTRGGRR